ncbi:RNA polymerase sigma factor [Hansschlegelia quercus]|uniref:RNA polymerase sigma factor n=1 Tax=Hansschlegelia quercus TaxID=2528245 RepID=A0A4Q9GHJ3_9HYPH|nr:RNA polymerase sigma factor [Hansschlegelia quercus]TBN53522.1 RNA polymerase sigma factor [Hansschlegelia quercus]
MSDGLISELYRLHGEELGRSLRRRGASRETAADITHDAFLRMLALPANVALADPRSFLFRVARNLSIDLARRRRALPLASDGEAALALVSDDAPSAERFALAKLELAAIQRALDGVPSAPREAFLMRLDGKTYDEIASSLGVPRQTAFSQVVRVIAHLAAAVGRLQK